MSKNKPTINKRLQNDTFKVLEIVGNPGDVLASHQVDHDAVLHIMSGSIIYREGSSITTLADFKIHSIKKKQVHSLEFIEKSKLLLFLFPNSKIKFESTLP